MSLNILQIIADPDIEISSEYINTEFMREVNEATIKMLHVTEFLNTQGLVLGMKSKTKSSLANFISGYGD